MAAGSGDGLGTVCWWGLTPALDLQEFCADAEPDAAPDGPPEVAALLVGAAEGRHVLRTMARAARWPPRAFTLYVAEERPEVVARQLLFLALAAEPPHRIGLQGRSAALLELLGSSRLRAATAAYLGRAAAGLRRWVRGGGAPPGPADLRLLKSRERDALEAVLRRWERPERGAFPVRRLWERRLRRHLGTRYDARAAVADWELRMALHERGARTLQPREFALWRESGVAFGGAEGGTEPNWTLASGRLPSADGQPAPDSGYWGDIVAGPFLAFGIESDDAQLLRGRDGLPEQGAAGVSLGNVTALLAALLPPPRPDGDSDGDSDGPGTPGGPAAAVRVRFLPLGSARRPPARAALQRRCRLLVLGHGCLQDLTPELGLLAAPGATLLVELPTFAPSLRREQLAAVGARAAALAEAAGFERWGGPGEPPACARFRRRPDA